MKCSICGGLIQDIYWEGEIPCSCPSRTESTQPMTTTPKPPTPLTDATQRKIFAIIKDTSTMEDDIGTILHAIELEMDNARSLELKLQETEHQRDEAKNELLGDKFADLLAERDQLIKVADELAASINGLSFDGYSCCQDGLHHPNRKWCIAARSTTKAITAYSLLPHVIAKKRNKQ